MKTRPLLVLFGVALLLRLAILFSGPWSHPTRVYPHSPDSPRYVELADTLLTHHTFGRPSEGGVMHLAVESLRRANGTLPPPDANGLSSEAFRTPGYPLFLAAFGGTPGLSLAYLAQCLLGAFAAVCLVVIAGALGCTPRAALAAGWLWALHPAAIVTDVLPLTESLFTSLGVIGLAAAAHPTTAGTGLSGVFIGATALVRPLGLLYLPSALILAWRTARRKWVAAGVMVLVALVPTVAWSMRNASAGHGARVSTVGDLNLYFYGAAYVIAEDRGDDWLTSWPARVEELRQRLAAKLQPGQDVFSLARKEAIAEFKARPVTTAKVAIKSEIKVLVDHSAGWPAVLSGYEYKASGFFSALLSGKLDTSNLSIWSLIALPWSALNALIALLAFVGLIRAALRRHWPLVFACLMPVVLFSVATFPVGLERFRLPFMPFLFVLTACAVWAPARPVPSSVAAGQSLRGV
jgi:hypothetical protein